ncbi:unnamed protein product [Pelagomonas calceolata]|uniref:BspA family leucine-rich repeat surface protein n=1 Tax=Pelagomonas calceolata TaxID=35677 RepID=A0A8J2SK14_9STRA|nr:unnamed protein product [Pelagomonas calceolata]
MMRSAALLCVASLLPAVAGIAMDDNTIRTAVTEWLSDASAAEATYGHISTWETGGVTDMSKLFYLMAFNDDVGAWDTSGVTSMSGMFMSSTFNQDIGAWDTSAVRTMDYMFYYASSFNRPIGDWIVDSITDMRYMFWYASAFDQDLGWCVADDVDLRYAFRNTPCEPTYCGVTRKNEFDECEAIVDDDAYDIFVVDDDKDDDDDYDDDDDCGYGSLCNDAATTRSAALAALVIGAAL